MSLSRLRKTILNRPQLIGWLAQYANLTRPMIAVNYLHGEGIEIGPLHNPMLVSKRARVKYLDFKTREELVRYYPEVDASKIPPVDIVTDGETLEGVSDESQDFLIASHMLEHTENPIRTLWHFFRVLKVGGNLFIVLPDKRFTFDVDRAVTPFEHLVRDYEEGPNWSRRAHYEDWVRFVMKLEPEAEIQRKTDEMMNARDNIHYHVWSQTEILEMLVGLQKRLGFPFDVEVTSKSGIDFMFVLKRTGPLPHLP